MRKKTYLWPKRQTMSLGPLLVTRRMLSVGGVEGSGGWAVQWWEYEDKSCVTCDM
jgi:hypothetical protein